MISATSVSNREGWKGVSVFAVDPGETTGWAWACVGRRELAQHGAEGALECAAKHRSGLLAGDVRFRTGQVGCRSGAGLVGFIRAEVEAANTLLIELLTCSSMTSRTSGGAVPGITDLVVEDFILRERTKRRDLLAPVRFTARFETLVQKEPELNPFLEYLAVGDAKGVVTDQRLRKWGFWNKGQRHARDATRHLILYLRKLELLA